MPNPVAGCTASVGLRPLAGLDVWRHGVETPPYIHPDGSRDVPFQTSPPNGACEFVRGERGWIPDGWILHRFCLPLDGVAGRAAQCGSLPEIHAHSQKVLQLLL